MKILSLLFAFITLSLLGSCSLSLKEKLSKVQSWGYQLQNYKKEDPLERIRNSPDRLWVLDPEFDKQKVSKSDLKSSSSNGTLLIAYLSIGEAEDYRDYFKKLSRSIILKENPNWKGNFKVKFWTKEWQEIIFRKVDEIIELGFSGVYLDIVDAFYYFDDKKVKADQMVEFIAAIRKHALKKVDEFLIIQQNAPTLYEYSSKNELLFKSVNALALEDLFFFGEKEHDNPYLPQDYALKAAKLYSKRGLKVFNVEYLKQAQNVSLYKSKWKNSGVVPLVANRKLNGPQTFAEDL